MPRTAAESPKPDREPASATDTGDNAEQSHIEADESADGYESGLTGASNSSTTSVSSSVLEYQYENGRRYSVYREGYTLPNDEVEQERLDMFHHIFTLILGGRLYVAPLDNPQRILDIGTGTGMWAIDMADENEQAEVLGNDLSPIQPNWVPPNVRFEVDDVEQPWTHQKDSFDYIHIRSLSGAIKDWHALLKQCYEHLQPGGYLEFQDYGAEPAHNSGPMPESAVKTWWTEITSCANDIGRPFTVAKHMKAWMEQAGFVDVHVQKEIWPLGPWPKEPKLRERGKWGLISNIDSLEAFALALLTRVKGWTTDEVKELCRNCKKELLSKENRYYVYMWFVYGKKPEGCTSA